MAENNKIIHYCWFGRGKKSKLIKKCIKSWKKYMPDYKIIEWNEDNFDVNCNPYVKEAYEKKKYAFVSDYVRLKVIYDNGGIYLDTDVELLKRIPDKIVESGYFAKESENAIATGLGFSAKKYNNIINLIMESYNGEHFINEDGTLNTYTCVNRTMDVLKKNGYNITPTTKSIDDIPIFSPEYFCGYDLKTNHYNITSNTISVHHYAATWQSKSTRIAKTTKKIISKLIGEKAYKNISKLKRR